MDNLYKKMATAASPPAYNPNSMGGTQTQANWVGVPTYACPADPSMSDNIQAGGQFGGTSYAANAQVFAPLASETIGGGAMNPSSTPNFCDRGAPLARLQDGTSNIILFMHVYALCSTTGSSPVTTGPAWGYTQGIGQLPNQALTNQPWQRASYIRGMTYQNTQAQAPFQNQPNPYASSCKPTDPATPHPAAMMDLPLGDAGVRSLVPSLTCTTWEVRLACPMTAPYWARIGN